MTLEKLTKKRILELLEVMDCPGNFDKIRSDDWGITDFARWLGEGIVRDHAILERVALR